MRESTYVFYVDVYFVQNVCIKIWVLMLSIYFSKLYNKKEVAKLLKNIIFAAIISTIVEIIGLLSWMPYSLWAAILLFLELPVIMWFLFGKELKTAIKMSVLGYFFLILVNGILEIFWNWFGKKNNYLVLIGIAAVTTFAVAFTVKKNKETMKGIYSVRMVHKGSSYEINALYDSGNRLKDPYTGKGVHIISFLSLQKLEPDFNGKVIIPFQSLGNENGILEVYYIDELYVDEKQIKLERVPIGVTKDKLFEGKTYEMILSEEIM